MSPLTVRMFGKLSVEKDQTVLDKLSGGKLGELFSYLVLNRGHPQPRETLAALQWGDTTTELSRKYLRQALWHIQAVIAGCAGVGAGAGKETDDPRILVVEDAWVGVNSGSGVRVDVEEFQRAYLAVQGKAGYDLREEDAETLRRAVDLYQGDLLEGCYQEWCLCERERLKDLYFAMLNKLMGYCERRRDFETGIGYGMRIIARDRARERVHKQLMILQYKAGDRTAALRQYARCVTALEEELGVSPAKETEELAAQIRQDRLTWHLPPSGNDRQGSLATLPELLDQLENIQTMLTAIQQLVHRDIKEIENSLRK